jgi:NADPH:quinone reductase-like Zn-dependent oxidoreductase
MRAMVFTEYGGPDALRPADVATPSPADDEVLVRVHASSINEWDARVLRGRPFVNRLICGVRRPRPTKQIPGADVAATVEAVGRDVTRWLPGDAVVGDLWGSWGAFAEYACIPAWALEPKPANLSFTRAAAVPQAGTLALQGLRCDGGISAGQRVLVNGAGGGVGTFAVQIAVEVGAEVTGVDRADKLDAVLAAGAAHVIDFATQDYTALGHRYDRILDVAGYRSVQEPRSVLRSGGVYVMIGGHLPRVGQAALLSVWANATRSDRRVRVLAGHQSEGLAELCALIDAGAVSPVIDRTYELADAADAYRRFETGTHVGKIVVAVTPDAG